MEWRKNKIFKVLLLTMMAMTLTLNSYNSQDSGRLNKSVWEEERKGIDYGDLAPKEEPKKDQREDPNFEPIEQNSDWINNSTVKAIVFGIIILLLLFLLYKIFGNMVFGGKINRRDQREFTLEEIEENLEEADIDFHLNKAVDHSDYRKAIRLYYLAIIKELTYRKWIKWKKDKTNYHYLREMRSRDQFEQFRDLTTAFEIVWYGEADIQEHHFERLKPVFKGFLNRIENLKL